MKQIIYLLGETEMEPCSFSSELVFLTVISSFPHTRLYVSIKLHKHPHPPTHTHTHTHTNTHAYMCEKDLFCIIYIVHSLVTQSCPTLWDPMDCSLPSSSVHGIFPGKSTGMGCHFLLQGIVLTQGMNQGLPLQAGTVDLKTERLSWWTKSNGRSLFNSSYYQ